MIIRQLKIRPNVANRLNNSPYVDSFYSMPNGLHWNGTIVALRIPYNAPLFNYIN